MADRGRRDESTFFIYDHTVLKKEEDDLKDAIIYFYPDTYAEDEQCALCGQLMGMSEYLTATISKSPPEVFRFEHEKYALKRSGSYTLALKGGSFTPDKLLLTQLTALYHTFVTFHGSIDSLKLRCRDSQGGFQPELKSIWDTILEVSGIPNGPSLLLTFQSLPYVQLPKSGAHLFLQASHLLQSSQRRLYVLAGAILYQNSVLSTQLPPKLTRNLTYLRNQMPHIVRKTECDLPVGCRVLTIFLTDEEIAEIVPLDSHARHHCKVTDFSVAREKEDYVRKTSKPQKQTRSPVKRRGTCPNLSVTVPSQKTKLISQQALNLYLASEIEKRRNSNMQHGSLAVEQLSRRVVSRTSLSSVPIVECRSGESPDESENDMLYDRANKSYFNESSKFSLLKQGNLNTAVENHLLQSTLKAYEQIDVRTNHEKEESESDSEDVFGTKTEEINSFSKNSDYTFEKTVETQTSVASNIGKSLNDENSQTIDGPSKEDRYEASLGDSHSETKPETDNNILTIATSNEVTDSVNNLNGYEKQKDQNESSKQQDIIKEKSDQTQKIKAKSIQKTNLSVSIPENGVSISDLENNTDEEAESDVEKFNLVVSKANMLYKKANGNSGVNESSEMSKYTSTQPNKADGIVIALANSSEESHESRYYDRIHDEETITVNKDSNHSVYKHVVAVHNDSSKLGGMSSTDNGMVKAHNCQDIVTAGLGDYSCINNVCSSNGPCPDVVQGSNDKCIKLDTSDSIAEDSFNNNEHDPCNLEKQASGGHCLCEENQTIHTACNLRTSEVVEKYERNSSSLKNHPEKEMAFIPKLKGMDKENVDPSVRLSKRLSSESQKYESEIETEDESISIATIDPCINCLELATHLSEADKRKSVIRCEECLARFNKQRMFGASRSDKEIIDFNHSKERYDSGNETEGQGNVMIGDSGQDGKFLSSLSSDVSTDSTISRYWTHEMDGLNDVTLYVQCHSDISLLLLLENPEQYQEDLFNALWKSCLAQLADLDYYIKECMDNSEDDGRQDYDKYRYLKYDSFAADVKGTIQDSHDDRRSSNFQQMLSYLHTEFQENQCLSDVTLRSHYNSCYGHSNNVEETFFQPELQQKLMSGFPVPKDSVFNLDIVARQKLSKDKHLSLL